MGLQRTVRNLKRIRGDHAAAAERALEEALVAGLELGQRLVAARLVCDLLVGGHRHVEGNLPNNEAVGEKCDCVSESES